MQVAADFRGKGDGYISHKRETDYYPHNTDILPVNAIYVTEMQIDHIQERNRWIGGVCMSWCVIERREWSWKTASQTDVHELVYHSVCVTEREKGETMRNRI